MHAGPPLAVMLGVAALVLGAAPAAAHEDPPSAVPSAVTSADPHAGHTAATPTAPPAPAADPHAGHAGHTAATPTVTPAPAADPHAGHGAEPHAGHGAEPHLVAPSDPPRAEVLTGFGVVNAGIVAAGLLVRRYDATHRRARRLS